MHSNVRSFFFSGTVIFLMTALIGCGGSDEAVEEAPQTPSATEMMQKELSDLRTQNESLNQQVAKCEVEKRTVTARVAELETELADWKDKKVETAPVSAPPAISNPRETYASALRLFNERKYDDAADLISKVKDNGIHATLLDNCDYWLGECSYGSRRFEEAIGYFEKVFSYQISEKKDDAQIMIGNCYKAMGNKARAAEAFESLLKRFPASPFGPRAKEKLQAVK